MYKYIVLTLCLVAGGGAQELDTDGSKLYAQYVSPPESYGGAFIRDMERDQQIFGLRQGGVREARQDNAEYDSRGNRVHRRVTLADLYRDESTTVEQALQPLLRYRRQQDKVNRPQRILRPLNGNSPAERRLSAGKFKPRETSQGPRPQRRLRPVEERRSPQPQYPAADRQLNLQDWQEYERQQEAQYDRRQDSAPVVYERRPEPAYERRPDAPEFGNVLRTPAADTRRSGQAQGPREDIVRPQKASPAPSRVAEVDPLQMKRYEEERDKPLVERPQIKRETLVVDQEPLGSQNPAYAPYSPEPAAFRDGGYGGHDKGGLAAAVAAGAAAYNGGAYADPQRLSFQIHGQEGPNSYRFGYDTGVGYNRQFRYEERDDNGVLHGRYGYYDQEGKLQIVNYSADPYAGFHAEGEHVPKPQY